MPLSSRSVRRRMLTGGLGPAEGGTEANMVLQRLFATRPTRLAGEGLYASAARQARRPLFYQGLGVADTGEGRFELYCLHVALVLIRLKGEGQAAAETGQRIFDVFIRSLDDALREMGVGDLAVGKKMKKLGEAFYGRAKSYEEALAVLPDTSVLEALLVRTVLDGAPPGGAPALTAYVIRASDGLRDQKLEQLLEGRASWPEPAA